MSSPLDRLDDFVRGLPPEHFDELDAKIRAKHADPNYVPRRVEWREDPDPLDMDKLCQWLERNQGSQAAPRPGCEGPGL